MKYSYWSIFGGSNNANVTALSYVVSMKMTVVLLVLYSLFYVRFH